jgi:hypothetical protein
VRFIILRCFLAFVATLSLLAGCLSPSADPPLASDNPAPTTAEPVTIDETVDLLQGVDGESWDFSIAPGAREVVIRFAVEGRGSQAWVGRSVCLTYHVESVDNGASEGSEGQCPSGAGNVVAQPPPFGVEERVMLEWDGSTAGPGHYSFGLKADPQPADLHVSVNVSY